ncbi:hypothetical protein ACFV4N_40915, partial [Actinosynnema sp. NPDC059797]
MVVPSLVSVWSGTAAAPKLSSVDRESPTRAVSGLFSSLRKVSKKSTFLSGSRLVWRSRFVGDPGGDPGRGTGER